MSNAIYEMVLETPTAYEDEIKETSKKKAVFEFKSKYLHKVIDNFNNYAEGVDKNLESKNIPYSLKSRAKKILIKDWINNNLYGSEFEKFVDLFSGNFYEPGILDVSERKEFENNKDVIPLLRENYNGVADNEIPVPKTGGALYRDIRAPILSEIAKENGFVFAKYKGNGAKIYFKEDLGSTYKDAIDVLIEPTNSNGLVEVYGFVSEMDGMPTLSVQIDNNGDVRAGKMSSSFEKYL